MLELNLKRARVLPAGKERYVLVNAAQQRLYMYEDGKPVDSMVVVVGKPKWPTPMLTAYIRYAALNPYWYVPPDLACEDVGPVRGQAGPQISRRLWATRWCPTGRRNPTIIDPKTIDWKGVVDGKVEIMIRQKPGPEEFHGADQVHVPQPVRGLPPRQSAARAVQEVDALFQRRLRAARGCVAARADGCSTAS